MVTAQDGTTASRLGRYVGSYRPGMVNLVAGVILGCIPMAFGLMIVTKAPGMSKDWIAAAIGVAIGIGVCAVGVGSWWFVYYLWSCRTVVYEKGFVLLTGAKGQTVTWEDIVEFRACEIHERIPILRSPFNLLLPRRISRSYVVVTRAGSTHTFTGNSTRRLAELAEQFRQHSVARSIPWNVHVEYP